MATRAKKAKPGAGTPGNGKNGSKSETIFSSNQYIMPQPKKSTISKQYPLKPKPEFKFIKLQVDPSTLKFHKCWTDGKSIYVRTDRLPRPIGGKTGTILKLNPIRKKLESAWFAGWGEWLELRDKLGLVKLEKDFDYVEVRIDSLQAVLKADRP